MDQHKRIEQCTEHGTHLVTCLDCGAQWHDTDPPEVVTEGDGSCDEQALADETATHWSYGGGSSGCLYDFGPEFSETKEGALDSLDQVYELTDGERATLERDGIVRFDTAYGSAVDMPGDPMHSRRLEVGADYCELTEQQGPCPESDD